MEKRSYLDDLADYDFTVKHLVHKYLSEADTRKLLEKRGLDPTKIDDLIREVKLNFSGVKFIESRKMVRFIGSLIDLLLLGIMLYLLIEIIPKNSIIELLLVPVVLLLYYWLLESKWGITVGKLITGSKLVDENYQTPSALKVLWRTICRLIPSPWWLNRPAHDQLSKTFVVNRKRLNELNRSKSNN
jgi:hypothetical protein